MAIDTVKLFIKDCPDFAANVLAHIQHQGLENNPNIYTKDKKRNRDAYGFNETFHSYIHGHSFWMAFNPKGSFDCDAVLILHPGKFPSWEDLDSWLRLVFGDFYENVVTAEINRIDLCVDLGIPYESIRDSIDQVNARTIREWKSDLRTLYLGEIPKRTRVYEKRLRRSQIDFSPRSIEDESADVLATRIEVEFLRHKVPINSLSEVSNLYLINPFEHLVFNEIAQALIENPKSRSCHIIDAFRYRVQKIGFAAAKREFNTGGNFGKTIAPYLGTLDLDLERIWINRLARIGIPRPQDANTEAVVA